MADTNQPAGRRIAAKRILASRPPGNEPWFSAARTIACAAGTPLA